MTDPLKAKQRITLAQLTLELQKLAANPTEQPESETRACASGHLENAIASRIASGMAKHRTGK